MSAGAAEPTVTILVPVYNEARLVEPLLRKVSAMPLDKQLLVIDDGSQDGSSEILTRLQPELGFELIRHARNRGKGAAIRSGLEAARGRFVLIQDADQEYDPDDYGVLLAPLLKGRATIVYGSRFLGPHRASYFWHRLGNWIITTSVNLLFNASLTDVETGYKVFRRDRVQGLALRASGFDIEVELTCKLLRRGEGIFEVPISYYGRSYAEGKKITWRDGVIALWVIAACRMHLW